MRKIMMIAAVAALGACSKPAEEPAAPASTAAAAEAATEAPVVEAGDYTFVDKDKKEGKLSIAADNTYSVTWPDGTTAKGTVSIKDGKGCYDEEGDKTPTLCWKNDPPAADGTWTATSDDGQVVTVTRVTK
jgi:hypothetical protein